MQTELRKQSDLAWTNDKHSAWISTLNHADMKSVCWYQAFKGFKSAWIALYNGVDGCFMYLSKSFRLILNLIKLEISDIG
jgi:hypothetical protein